MHESRRACKLVWPPSNNGNRAFEGPSFARTQETKAALHDERWQAETNNSGVAAHGGKESAHNGLIAYTKAKEETCNFHDNHIDNTTCIRLHKVEDLYDLLKKEDNKQLDSNKATNDKKKTKEIERQRRA